MEDMVMMAAAATLEVTGTAELAADLDLDLAGLH